MRVVYSSVREMLDEAIDDAYRDGQPIRYIELTKGESNWLLSELAEYLQYPDKMAWNVLEPGGVIGYYRLIELRLAPDPLPSTEAAEAEQAAK